MKGISLTLLLLISIWGRCNDRSQFIHFEKKDGMAFGLVTDFVQDSRGFLWIASNTGLARYDGYNFEIFLSADNKNSLPADGIFCLLETSNNDLLVGTSGGLVVYNRANNNFKHLLSGCINAIVEDNMHQIWVSSYDGIFVFDGRSLKQKYTLFGPEKGNTTNFWALASDGRGQIWSLSNGKGIFVIDARNFKITKTIDNRSIKHIEQGNYHKLAMDKSGDLWLGSLDNGLMRIDTAVLAANIYKNSNSDRGSLGSNTISTIFVDKNNDVWVCCQNGFLNKYIRKSDSFYKFKPQKYNAKGITSSSITCVKQDKSGNYWIGAYGNGVYCLSKNFNKFDVFSHEDDKLIKVSSFVEIDTSKVAIATDGGGVFFLNPTSKEITEFPNNNKLASTHVHKIIKHKNDLWGATWGGGIFKIDLTTSAITNYVHDVNNSQSINLNNVKGLYADNSLLYVGTHGDGLTVYDYNENKFESSKTNVKYSSISQWINDVTRDSRGDLWVSTYYGLYQSRQNIVNHFLTDKNNPKTINNNDALSVYEDTQKRIWLLTTQGISLYDQSTKQFTRESNRWMIPGNTRAMVQDDDGRFWVSTGDKLVCHDEKTKKNMLFDEGNGTVQGEFIINSAYKSSTGILFFGASDGFMMLDPRRLTACNDVPRLLFTDIFVNYIKQTVDSGFILKSLPESDTIEYNYCEDVISIQVAGILLGTVNKINYTYRFDKADNQWLDLGKIRIISFNSLSPGTHVLSVKASSDFGISTQKQLVIIVHPKWWMTWWFKVLITLVIISLVSLIVFLRLQRIKSKNIQLERLVKKRTTELEQANITLTQQSETLSKQAESLQQQNQSLAENQVFIEMKNSQLEEALSSKDKLIGVIAHDFKNPLSAVYGLSEILHKNADRLDLLKIKKYTNGIMMASESLKTQMISVLDWAQSQVQDLICKPVEINIETIIDDAILLVKESSSQKNIAISTQLDYETNACIDPRMMSTVLRNLLINAIKFTPRGGLITIIVQEFETELEVSVVDTGVGISADKVSTLFDKLSNTSTSGTESEKGVGLGLQICKSFVEQNNGTIAVSSSEGNGTVFCISMPKGKNRAVRKIQQQPLDPEFIITDMQVDKNQTLLIIDDNATMVTMLKASFSPYYTVVTASDGNMGLQIARNIVPQLIISDITMPHLSGIELCSALKTDEMTNHIPIVLLTADKESSLWREAYSKGADDFIEKPFIKELLLYKVQSLLENRKKFVSQLQPKAETKGFILPESLDDAVMKRVFTYLNENYSDSEIDLHNLAQIIGLSRTQLWRKFKSTTGQNMVDYIQILRMQKAREMLLTGKYKIAEVAYDVGFTNPQYFTKCFLQHFGETPKDFADKNKNRT